jgi:hypothetical protein
VALALIYSVASIIILKFTWNRIEAEVRRALFWYFFFYFFSNMLGSIIFGLAGEVSFGEFVDFMIDNYIQGEYIQPDLLNLYWFLVFSPFLILPFFCMRSKYIFKPAKFLKFTPSFLVYSITVLIIMLIFITEIIMTNNIGIITLSTLTGSKENYTDYIIGRNDIYSSMSNRFFGYLYMTLPFFTNIAVYNALKAPDRHRWIFCSVVLILFITIISIGVNQKAPLLIFYISILAGISMLIKVKLKFILLVPVLILLIVNALQIFVQGDDGWNMLFSFFHTIFRAPASMPFYVNYYPRQLPFVGPDFGILANLHIPAKEATDNIEMHTIMWGQFFEKFGVTGSVAAPFQFRAFAQAGLFFAIVNVVLISFFLRTLGWIYKTNVLGCHAITHAFFTQSLIVLYFLSQTHIKDCLWSSYGVIWIIHGYILLLVVGMVFRISNKINLGTTRLIE